MNAAWWTPWRRWLWLWDEPRTMARVLPVGVMGAAAGVGVGAGAGAGAGVGVGVDALLLDDALAGELAAAGAAAQGVLAATRPVRWLVLGVLRPLFVHVVVWPLWVLYFRGPALGGVGFYRGRPPADICAQLTGVDASFWASGADAARQCDRLLQRDFEAFFVGCMFAAYAAAILALARSALSCCRGRRRRAAPPPEAHAPPTPPDVPRRRRGRQRRRASR